MVSFFAEVKIFRFWPKTMDYNKAFLPKSRSFFAVFLLLTGRCYGAKICAILLLLKCSFRWYPFLPKSKFSDFGRKPWTIIRHFNHNQGHCLQSFSALDTTEEDPLPSAPFLTDQQQDPAPSAPCLTDQQQDPAPSAPCLTDQQQDPAPSAPCLTDQQQDPALSAPCLTNQQQLYPPPNQDPVHGYQ